MYSTYKITNTVDNMVYYGSTKQPLTGGHYSRMTGHFSDARNGNPKKISEHIRKLGDDKFNIELIQSGYETVLDARKAEQALLDAHEDKSTLLNATRAYSFNQYYTRDQVKLKAKKKRYYDKKRLDPEWVEKQRLKERQRMANKRAINRASDDYVIDCPCGGWHNKNTRYEHSKTQIHQNYLKKLGQGPASETERVCG